MIAAWLAAVTMAGPIATTEMTALTVVDHGLWVGCTARALSTGDDGSIGCSATATQIALLTTPVVLTSLQPTDPVGQRRVATAWGLYWVGVGVDALGFAAIGVDRDGHASGAIATAADLAFIGAAGFAVAQLAGDQTAPVFTVAKGRF